MDKILEKIRKLLNITTANGATPEEAANAAARAQEIMVKYAIEESELIKSGQKADEKVETKPIGLKGQRINRWKALLAYVFAPSFFCRSFFTPGGDIWVVGRATDREILIATWECLVYEIQKMAAAEWEKQKRFTEVHGKRWKDSFYQGVCAVINQRLTKNTCDIVNKDDTGSTAIILANRQDAVVKYMEEKHDNLKKSAKKTADVTGYVAGVAAGSKLDLSGRATKKLGD